MHFSFDRDIILENERALLRPVTNEDVEHLLAVATEDPLLLQYSPKPVYNRELLTRYIQNAVEERKNRTRYSFSIFCRKENAYAGSTAFLTVSQENDSLEIGATWLGKRFRGTGLNQNCKHLLLTYAFETLGANRVAFRTDERNAASRTALRKIGATMEGILREDMVLYDGFRRSSCYFSILRTEWFG